MFKIIIISFIYLNIFASPNCLFYFNEMNNYLDKANNAHDKNSTMLAKRYTSVALKFVDYYESCTTLNNMTSDKPKKAMSFRKNTYNNH